MMDTLAALTIVQKAALIPLFPLIAAVLITLLGGKVLKGLSHLPAIAGVLASFIVAVSLLMSYNASDGGLSYGNVFTWFGAGGFHVPVGVYVDSLSILFVCFVTGISTLIFIYSGGYMAGDYGYFRFFAYLSIFVFFMCMLVLANNFVLVYLGWEGVGLASYLLVGYYYPKPSAREAAKKSIYRQSHWRYLLCHCYFYYLPHISYRKLSWCAWRPAPAAERIVAGRASHGHILDTAAADGGCVCQVSSASSARVVARCDGRSHARVGAHSCRNHGYRRRLFSGALHAAVSA